MQPRLRHAETRAGSGGTTRREPVALFHRATLIFSAKAAKRAKAAKGF
jgi:hypothetical protein